MYVNIFLLERVLYEYRVAELGCLEWGYWLWERTMEIAALLLLLLRVWELLPLLLVKERGLLEWEFSTLLLQQREMYRRGNLCLLLFLGDKSH
jgi:hypothetical protein